MLATGKGALPVLLLDPHLPGRPPSNRQSIEPKCPLARLFCLKNALKHVKLTVDRTSLQARDVQSQNPGDERIDIHIFKGCEGNSWPNVRSGRKENGLHLGHSSRVVSVSAHGRMLRFLRVRGGADEVRAGGNDHGIAFARVTVEMEIGRHPRAPVDKKLVAFSAEREVRGLRIVLGFWVKNRTQDLLK